MIAMVGRILLNRNGKNLYVLNPYPGAINFYTDKCGFETVADYLVMTNNKINDFINRVQRKTNSEISEIKE